MTTSTLQEFAQYCKHRGGDTLQSVFRYTDDDAEVVYARPDVEDLFSGESFAELQEAAWEVHTTILAEAPRVPSLGEYRVTVHTFERGFVMQFRETERTGVAVTFDRDVGRNLHEFLLECENYLEGM